MLRLATAMVFMAGFFGASAMSINMLAAGADIPTIFTLLSIWILAGVAMATIFYGVCKTMESLLGPRAATAAASSASTSRKGFSLGFFNPLNVLRFMIVGDPVEDGLRARRREISAEMDRKNKEENGMFNQGKVKKAGDDEVKRYLASVKS